MSKKKSLGSSPIGFNTVGSLGFIPDLGVGKPVSEPVIERESEDFCTSSSESSMHSVEKKTVSYYLETDLIAKIKAIARKKDMCYSALVSNALHRWVTENG